MARQSERDSDGFDLPRLSAVMALYAVYVIMACLFVGSALDGLDAAFPFAFFYHLQDGEADGPIGDPMRLATGMWLQLLAFWLFFAPIAIRLRMPRGLLIGLTVCNEPIALAVYVMIERWVVGLPVAG